MQKKKLLTLKYAQNLQYPENPFRNILH